jgi:hypothetical protein
MELLNYQDKLYLVVRKIKENKIKPQHISDVRELFQCDLVLKRPNTEEPVMLFLKEIRDAEVIE